MKKFSPAAVRDLAGSVIDLVFDGPQMVGRVGAGAGALWKYCRSRPLEFSLLARCHGERESQKDRLRSAVMSMCQGHFDALIPRDGPDQRHRQVAHGLGDRDAQAMASRWVGRCSSHGHYLVARRGANRRALVLTNVRSPSQWPGSERSAGSNVVNRPIGWAKSGGGSQDADGRGDEVRPVRREDLVWRLDLRQRINRD